MEPHLNRSHGDAKSFGCLLHITVFHLAQHKDLSVSQRKGCQSLTDERTNLLAFKSLRGNLAPVGQLHRDDLTFAVIVQRIGKPRLHATKSAASLIEDDTDKPRAEAGLSTETPEVPICLQEGILRGILSLSLVVQHRKAPSYKTLRSCGRINS